MTNKHDLRVLTSTTGNRKDTWNTPSDIVNDVVKFFGTISLDPCCNDINNPNVPALKYYTETDDGLSHFWVEDNVFMNHPYSDSKSWIPYAVEMYEKGYAEQLILLIKVDTSTKWFKDISGYPFIAVNKRLKFGDGTTPAPFHSAIFYLGNHNLERFREVFGKYGYLYGLI